MYATVLLSLYRYAVCLSLSFTVPCVQCIWENNSYYYRRHGSTGYGYFSQYDVCMCTAQSASRECYSYMPDVVVLAIGLLGALLIATCLMGELLIAACL